jgi:two-component system, LuxR family, response regulator FixJ
MADRRQLVLIVDDDQAVRDALQFALRLEGLCVHVHSGGAALLADPDLNRARCVILADRMRQMDGFTLMDSLKARAVSLPAIMLTGHATPAMRQRADAAGVRTILEKPLLDNALMENIRSILTHD